ncbi:uncharacterized protein LOC100865440 isoform X2 [Apis florea]|uniref:uncharacterized protein LOC100865440 isoform X1 n=1 Tax=Apis florea TaxID=7463 RepID=UPI000252C049|nr:uncharacterized protein LOC100865440 isoform X1 [Apis florea]XP_012345813.1 uncharacterized protein LOC100865440 isoform X1 [Apis florea]XP_031774193.1 uncharacterized protein LOC100865440 isoform X2 [Apis florea]
MDNIEQQCEDAVFEVCDARERYPSRCADELQKSIKLKNNMNMLKKFQKSIINDVPDLQQDKYMKGNLNFNKNKICFNYLDSKLQNSINKLNNLKAIMDQIEREKTCCINKLLEH